MSDKESGEIVRCDYCDSDELAYELQSGRGPVVRCIECLAIERGQPRITWEGFQDYPEHLQKHTFQKASDWFTILARLKDDEPIIKRDPDAMATVSDGTRAFLQNVMGSAAHYSRSEIIESDGDPGQTTPTDGGSE